MYPPNGQAWNLHDHDQMMMVTLVFAWHNAAIFILIIATGLVVKRTVTGRDYFVEFDVQGDKQHLVLDTISSDEDNVT